MIIKERRVGNVGQSQASKSLVNEQQNFKIILKRYLEPVQRS